MIVIARLRSAVKPVLSVAAAIATAMFVAACAMSQSTLVSPKDAVGCESSGGAYSLSKSFMAFEIHQEPTGIGNNLAHYIRLPGALAADAKKSGIAVLVRPDPTFTYCLDYLSSITSNDTFNIEKTDHILSKVTTVSDDQSVKIAQNLIKTLFVGLSENANFYDDKGQVQRNLARATLGSTLVFSGVVDPFDHEDVNRTNDAIRRFGYCLFLEGEPIDPGHDDIDAYCENPMAWNRKHLPARSTSDWRGHAKRTIDRVGHATPPRKFSQGIFYRPRIPVTYYLYVKDNLKLKNVRGAWKLRGTQTALLENAAPILSVGVDRTFFANRSTTLDFDQGALKDIKISKGSELANFSSIPLQVAQSVVALPTNIIQVKINTANNEAALIAAQDNLIKVRRELAADRLAAANAAAGTSSTSNANGGGGGGGGSQDVRNLSGSQSFAGGNGNPQAVCFTQCMAQGVGSSEPKCTQYCSCRTSVCLPKGYDDLACSNFCGQPGL